MYAYTNAPTQRDVERIIWSDANDNGTKNTRLVRRLAGGEARDIEKSIIYNNRNGCTNYARLSE